jgi:hypothetical protein
MLVSYFADISSVLANAAKVVKPGGAVAWVVGDSAPYGIYVDTPKIIGLVATDLGYTVSADEQLRTRGLRWRTNGTRHQIDLSERLTIFTRPTDTDLHRGEGSRPGQ